MAVHTDLQFGESGQTLEWLSREGRPSSITGVAVFDQETGDDGAAEAATSGAPAIDSVATTVSADSGISQADRHRLNLTATTNVDVGRFYRVQNATGEREWVEVVEVGSGFVRARAPLQNDYANGDAFESTLITVAVDDTWAADDSHLSDDTDPNPGYRVRWEYVVAGQTYVHDAYFDLVRYRGGHDVTPADMERFSRGWSALVHTYHQDDQGQKLIDAGHEDLVLKLQAAGIADEMARNAWTMRQLTMRAAEYQLHLDRVRSGGEVDAAFEVVETRYHRAVEGLITVAGHTDFARDTAGSGHRAPPAPIWRR